MNSFKQIEIQGKTTHIFQISSKTVFLHDLAENNDGNPINFIFYLMMFWIPDGQSNESYGNDLKNWTYFIHSIEKQSTV